MQVPDEPSHYSNYICRFAKTAATVNTSTLLTKGPTDLIGVEAASGMAAGTNMTPSKTF